MHAPRDNDDSWSISADWIIPVASEPIRNGVLRMRGSVIEALGPAGEIAPARRHERLAGQAVLPGLVNAHCHLELTDLRGRLPRGRPITQWLFALLQTMRSGLDFAGGARRGARELLAGGCTTVADISHDNRAWRTLKDLPIRKVCFAEITGIGPFAGGAMVKLAQRLEGIEPDERLAFGVSPHAPYSTAEGVYRQVVELAGRLGMPVTTHLAETPQERKFLREGTGKFFEFLAHLGLIDTSVKVHRASPIEFARRVGLLEAAAILAHVNVIDDDELDLLAAGRASVAYCPRSSAFFGRKAHRYAEMLARGVNVCVGTDSLASNDSLDMLAELRAVWAQGQLDAATILRMGTLSAARALGMGEQVGSLATGKQADWIAVPIGKCDDPVREILQSERTVARVVIAGQNIDVIAKP